MAPTTKIPTTFLIISDTHNFSFSNSTTSPLQLPTPPTDVLLHCGDLTEIGGLPFYRKALEMLSSIPAELKLVIAGNHDLELDKTYWDTPIAQRRAANNPVDPDDHRRAIEIMTGELAQKAGVTYLTEGTYEFTLRSGATFKIYVSPYTPEFWNWSHAYLRNQDRFNLPPDVEKGSLSIATNPIPRDVDIVMTHGPPKGILDECAGGHVGCDNLMQAIMRVKPMVHCFGHIHEGSGAEIVDWKAREGKEVTKERQVERKNEAVHRFFEEEQIENPYPEVFEWREGKEWEKRVKTLAVNASIRDGRYKPSNAPWRIRVDLKRAA
ncbi:MAG: hypothetical protein Q9209_006207 [Squamulea sp. 1 TL-2023]